MSWVLQKFCNPLLIWSANRPPLLFSHSSLIYVVIPKTILIQILIEVNTNENNSAIIQVNTDKNKTKLLCSQQVINASLNNCSQNMMCDLYDNVSNFNNTEELFPWCPSWLDFTSADFLFLKLKIYNKEGFMQNEFITRMKSA